MKTIRFIALSLKRPYLITGLELRYFWLMKSAQLLGNAQIFKSESADFKFSSSDFLVNQRILLKSRDFNEIHSHLSDLNRETS